MSRWQLFSDNNNNNNFRWNSDDIQREKALIQKPPLIHPTPLPCISDLLFQGYAKLYDDHHDENQTHTFGGNQHNAGYENLNNNQSETRTTFTTGRGGSFRKPLLVNQSVLPKPKPKPSSSSLGNQPHGADSGYAKVYERNKSVPAFTTGLGKPLVVNQSSLAKASYILQNQDIEDTGYSKIEDDSKLVGTSFTFRTGSGKQVAIKQSSMAKAQSMFGGQDDDAFVDTGFAKQLYQDDQENQSEAFRTGGLGIQHDAAGYQNLYQNQTETSTTFTTGGESLGKTVQPRAADSVYDQNKGVPTFTNGLGKPVVVNQSSLAKASYIPQNQDIADAGYSKLKDDSKLVGTSFTFRTGSGKQVAIKQSSMAKAQSMFGGQHDDDAFVDTGCFKVHEDNIDYAVSPLTFQSGSGNAVAARKSSIEKAFSILGDLDDNLSDWAGNSVGGNNGSSSLNSMFQTGSGKAVTICSTGLVKARTLLGLEENSNANSDANVGTNIGVQECRSVPNSTIKLRSGVCGGDIRNRSPLIKFQTAGGRSVKVSGDALKRARSLLGDPDLGNFLNEGDACSPVSSFNKNMPNKENNGSTSFSDYIPKAKNVSTNFISPFRSALSDKKTAVRSENIGLRSNLIKEFDAVEPDISIMQNNSNTVGVSSMRKSLSGPLVDISNTIGEKRKMSSRKYPSPFKKPRNSKFIPPLNKKSTTYPNGSVPKNSEGSCCKRRVSTRYPFQFSRKYIKEYLGEPPYFQDKFENLPEGLRKINSENADKHMFEDETGLRCIGLDSFFHLLVQSGCSNLSKEWIANHYRWIVWKLACYERGYPAKFYGKLLTVSNVLEELKYRYEREVNNGHRSALKRILEGDAPPSSPLILCIASIQSDTEVLSTSKATESCTVTSIELTDGWYSVKGLVDDLLLKQLVTRKLFVGQKLRICGAGLSGWNAPVSPLEASRMISLCLHINGTYRAHWADRLGFCKSGCAPLAFNCIKGSGGEVPSTLVGVTRIYPVLYRERLSDGGFVTRSERMESKRVQLYDQRRSSIVEGVMAEFQRGLKTFKIDNGQNTVDEGEKIAHLLERAAEPELLMADMSLEQLTSFSSYQAKVEAIRQSEMEKSIEKALEQAGLSRRDVSTLIRVRVVGLTSQTNNQKSCAQQGLITIWNPTEKQQSELVEGQAYAVAGLTPINSDSSTIYLRAKGSTTKWRPLSPPTIQQFQPFFSPRKPISLLNMGEVPLASEFDVAAFVIYVGEVNKSSHQKKQWIFVADGSFSSSHPHELSDTLLAISFCSSSAECDSILPVNYNLLGSTVGFCNLIKCAKDQTNHLWVAEATENSTYFLSYDGANSKHLKHAVAFTQNWAKTSIPTIEKLKGKIASILARKE